MAHALAKQYLGCPLDFLQSLSGKPRELGQLRLVGSQVINKGKHVLRQALRCGGGIQDRQLSQAVGLFQQPVHILCRSLQLSKDDTCLLNGFLVGLKIPNVAGGVGPGDYHNGIFTGTVYGDEGHARRHPLQDTHPARIHMGPPQALQKHIPLGVFAYAAEEDAFAAQPPAGTSLIGSLTSRNIVEGASHQGLSRQGHFPNSDYEVHVGAANDQNFLFHRFSPRCFSH